MRKKPPLFKSKEWSTCYKLYIESRSATRTQGNYDLLLRRFFAFAKKRAGHEVTPDKVTRRDIEEFLHEPSQKGYRKGHETSPYTKNTTYVILKSFYGWCSSYLVEFRGKQRPICKSSPMVGMKMAKVPRADRDMDEGELERFFAVIDKSTIVGLRDTALFKMLISTGRRRAEIVSLRRGDLEQVMLTENGQLRQGWIYAFKGKGHATKDDVAELPVAGMDALIAYHAAVGRDFLTLPPEFPLFPGGPPHGITPSATSRPIHVNHVNRRFRRYRKMAGLPNNLCVHSLRREYAWTRYTLNGHDILDIQKALRHRSVLTTMIYVEGRKRRGEGDPLATSISNAFSHL